MNTISGSLSSLTTQILLLSPLTSCLVSILNGSLGALRRVWYKEGIKVHPEVNDLTFDDVKGLEEAKQELQVIVEFFKDPERFSILGGKLPKGVLLVGPPGSGKTLLARAVAGEAGVPLFLASGHELLELFSKAKLKAPCVVFIDEIDSECANEAIDQLLSEMDSFGHNEGIIVLGATNKPNDLDPGMLRPGRFDVHVNVAAPEFNTRKEILELYMLKVKLSNDVNTDVLSHLTRGLESADLQKIVNRAALRAATDGQASVSMKYLEDSIDRFLMGPQRKSRSPDEEGNVITAYHEAGHVLVAHFTKDSLPLYKVTIVPRGDTLGHTTLLRPKEDVDKTKSQMLAKMDVSMGGRAAEELVFGCDKITKGTYDDLKRAKNLAMRMVVKYAMSEKIGFQYKASDADIDSEVNKMLQDSYERAKAILKTHSREHRLLAEALLKYETLNAEEIENILTK